MHLSALNIQMQTVFHSMNKRIIETYEALKRFDKNQEFEKCKFFLLLTLTDGIIIYINI